MVRQRITVKNNLKSQKDIEGFGELEYKELFDTWVQTFLSLYDSYPKLLLRELLIKVFHSMEVCKMSEI